MKLIEQISARRVLLNHANDKPPIQLGYKMAMFIKASDNDAEFFQEKMNEIVDTYGQKDPNGKLLRSKDTNNIIIQNGKIDECNAKIKELEEMLVEPISIKKFTLEELAPIQFTVEELTVLCCYIEQNQ